MFGKYNFLRKNKMFLHKSHVCPMDKSSLHHVLSNICQISMNVSRNLKNSPTNLKVNTRNFSSLYNKNNPFQQNVEYLYNHHLLIMPRALKSIKYQNTVNSYTRCYSTRISRSSHHNETNEPIPESLLLDQEDENIKYLFPSPKNTLHNAYDNVARQLKNETFRLSPIFNLVKEHKNSKTWCCTYNLLWPESKKIARTGHSKQDASYKAATAALTWLRKMNKLTKDGQPVIFDRNEIKNLVKNTRETINLDDTTIDCMQQIIERHKSVFLPSLMNNLEDRENNNNQERLDIDDTDNESVGLGDVPFRRNIKPQMFGIHQYLAKEKVELPIARYKEEFMQLLKENRVVLVKGEPGCGKSTRIPQYVLESWAKEAHLDNDDESTCRVAVTQPRRIAAISLAERVAHERDESVGHIVGYQVRLKSNFKLRTGRILYCTTGILLRCLQSDPYLQNFSHIIIDEAHERDLNTDLLMNLLKTIVMENNQKLKVIIMSATIDSDLFNRYFTNAPCMHIPGFTYPVQEHFLNDLPINLDKTRQMCSLPNPSVVPEDVVNMIHYIHKNKPEGAILCFLPGWQDITKIQKMLPRTNDVFVLCLHSRLQDKDQYKIFSRPPPGIRKIILSTNIAETSVTIDDVVYVIDTGVHKENRFDNDKGVYCIDNHWITKSNMKQRKGRAGRVRSGESFHLYTREKFNEFDTFSIPEILRSSLIKIVLDSKVYSNHMDTIEFFNKLPSPPDQQSIRYAINELKDLELFDKNENLTSLGKVLVNFQLEPKLAKTLVNSIIYKCCTPIVDIITLFSSETELFTTGLIDKSYIKTIKQQFCKTSDHIALMRIFEKWLELSNNNVDLAQKFCMDANLIPYKLITIEKLRQLHFDYLYNGLHGSLGMSDQNSDNDELVKAVLLSGVGTLLQYRNWDIVKGRYKKTNMFITNKDHKSTITSESVNFKKTEFPSNYFVYINETRSNIRRTTLIRECSIISPLSVLLFSNNAVEIKEELEDDQVVVGLTNSKIEFLCPKEQALTLLKCKEALNSGYQYYIFQLTEGKEFDKNINETWDEILHDVSRILTNHST